MYIKTIINFQKEPNYEHPVSTYKAFCRISLSDTTIRIMFQKQYLH